MTDLLNTLRARRKERTAHDEDLRRRLKEFEALLKETAGERDVYGHSEQCELQDIGESDCSYGYLFFDGSLQIAYRTTEDDLSDSHNSFEPTFTCIDIDKCSPIWLRRLATEKAMASLALSLIVSFEADIAASVRGVRAVEAMANFPLRELEVGIVYVATQLGYSKVLEQWQKAQAAVSTDAEEAVTRASQLIETLCKHILDSIRQPIPTGTPDVQDLYKAALKALSLSPDNKMSDALTRISSGSITVVLGVATLRNHASIAHGADPSSIPVTFSQARLAVNAAGVLAMFLMEAMLVHNPPQCRMNRPQQGESAPVNDNG